MRSPAQREAADRAIVRVRGDVVVCPTNGRMLFVRSVSAPAAPLMFGKITTAGCIRPLASTLSRIRFATPCVSQCASCPPPPWWMTISGYGIARLRS